jgi:hypothetical protein
VYRPRTSDPSFCWQTRPRWLTGSPSGCSARSLGSARRTSRPPWRSFAAHGFDASATAAAIPVHRNTLLHRVKRIEKLTGLNLREQQDRSLVLLAVMLGEQPGTPAAGLQLTGIDGQATQLARSGA